MVYLRFQIWNKEVNYVGLSVRTEGLNRNFKRLASGEARLDTNALFSWRHETGGKRTPPTF